MNDSNVKKRNILSLEEFFKDSEKSEKAKHAEKGEHEIVKKAMSGEKKGEAGYSTLEEAEKGEADPKDFSKMELMCYSKNDGYCFGKAFAFAQEAGIFGDDFGAYVDARRRQMPGSDLVEAIDKYMDAGEELSLLIIEDLKDAQNNYGH